MAGIEEFQIQENELWSADVQKNLTYLTENIGNLTGILIHLKEYNIISQNEIEILENETTTMKKNHLLLTTVKSKGWSRNKFVFIKILRETTNVVCADLIEYHEIPTTVCLLIGIIDRKWWPEKLNLPTSFFDRKSENELLTEKLKKILIQNENKITVINQRVAVSGLGGIGKTTTAKSFALKYAEDYDLILWIDCGEGSLLKTFTKLGRDLDLPKREELELNELACRSFDLLKESKCLFIFDNAECYVGKDGIREVLPKNHDKFHVIITSRNREWGQGNIDGSIPEFKLDVFGEDEGLEFMKENVQNVNEGDEAEMKILCSLLSYLPLALQIAVSTLNNENISLDEYIKQIKTKDEVLNARLDDYEKTIKKILKVTLRLIQNHETKNIGKTAIQILNIFGYITPDAVDSSFFMAVKNATKGFLAKLKDNYLLFGRKKKEFDEATNLLQLFSIISKTDISEGGYKLNIHRLFQQVIRHNTRGEQNQILRQIFSSEGFLDYKLIPFTYYADEELQKEFPKLKAELIDKLQLKKLLWERRFEEAVELSRLMKDSIQTSVSLFNFALCLKYNHANEEAKNILQELLKNTEKHENIDKLKISRNDFSFVMDSNKNLTREYIARELFWIYSEKKDKKAARQIFRSELINKVELINLLNERMFEEAVESSRLIKDSIHTPVSIFNFALCLKYNLQREEAKKILQELMNNTKRNGNINEIKIKNYNFSLIMDSKKELTFIVAWELFLLYCEEKDEEAARQIFLSVAQMKLWECSFNSSVLPLLPQSLQKLTLEECTISNGSSPTFGGVQLPPLLNELSLLSNKFVDDDGKELKSLDISQLIPLNLNKLEINGSMCVSLDRLKLIPSVHLGCSLILVPGLPITPEELTLWDVKFFAADREPIGNVLVNDFVNFRQMKELTLIGMSIDLCDPLTLTYLNLNNTKVLDWKKANWTVHKLQLWNADFVDRTGMKVTEMEIYKSSIDISVLPSTIQKLKLEHSTLVNFSFLPVHHIKLLPNLNQLYLEVIKINQEKNYSNNDDLLRVFVPNFNKWEIKKGNDYSGDYLDGQKN